MCLRGDRVELIFIGELRVQMTRVIGTNSCARSGAKGENSMFVLGAKTNSEPELEPSSPGELIMLAF